MSAPTLNEIAKAIYENHKEQCCTCGDWPPHRLERLNFLRPARAVRELFERKAKEDA